MDEILTQYLTFSLDEEVYAVSVSKVREVLEMIPITKVPRMPSFMKGVLNLRGSVVPVIDLRLKFGLDVSIEDKKSSIIIVELTREGKIALMGVLVDAVHEVVDLANTTIQEAPSLGTSVDSSFIEGMCEQGDNFVILLNINQVLSTDEILQLKTHSQIAEEETEATGEQEKEEAES